MFAKNLTKSVGTKLFFIVFASIVLLVAAIGAISYSISKNVIQNKVAEASLQTINQASRRLDNLFSSFEDLSNQVVGSSDIKLLLYNYYSAPATSQLVASLSAEQKTISEGQVRLSDHLEGLSNTLKISLSKFQV